MSLVPGSPSVYLENLLSSKVVVFRPADMSVPDYLIAKLNPDGSLSVPADLTDIVLYGPYISLPPGLYEFHLEIDGEGDEVLGEFDLFDHGKTLGVVTADDTGSSLNLGCLMSRVWNFASVPPGGHSRSSKSALNWFSQLEATLPKERCPNLPIPIRHYCLVKYGPLFTEALLSL